MKIQTRVINIFKYLYFIQKKNNQVEKINLTEEKEEKKQDCEFYLRLNRRTASVLTCALAFIVRYIYYHRLEKVDIWEYFDKDNFEQTYNDLRYMMLFLDKKSESIYKNYKNFKVYIDKEK